MRVIDDFGPSAGVLPTVCFSTQLTLYLSILFDDNDGSATSSLLVIPELVLRH